MRAFVAAVVAALLIAARSGAQDSLLVSESEFLASIDDSHPAVEALLETLGEAEATAIRARAWRDPELGASRESPSGATRQLDVTLSWQPPRLGRRHLMIAGADAGVDAARARFAIDRSLLLREARATFAGWAVAAAKVDRLASLAADVDRLAERERRRADSGEVSGLNASRLGLAAIEIRGELGRAEAERRATNERARAWRPDLPLTARPQLPALPPLPALPDSTHPRIAALTNELEAARALERLAGKIAEMPEILGGWQRQETAGETFEGPIFGVAWPLPLLDRRRADRAVARVRVESLEARLAVSKREVTAARAAALAAYEELSRAEAAAGQAAAGAPAIVAAATAAFRAGETDVTDLLDTLRSATSVQVRALELHAEALAAHRDLELASLSSPASLASPASHDAAPTPSAVAVGAELDSEPVGDPR